MNKKIYCIPEIEVMEMEELCETGMNNNSYYTKTRKVADDQTDVEVNDVEIEKEPLIAPIEWNW